MYLSLESHLQDALGSVIRVICHDARVVIEVRYYPLCILISMSLFFLFLINSNELI